MNLFKKNYVISRSQIYAGVIAKIPNGGKQTFINYRGNKIVNWSDIRGTIFSFDENKCANDLIFTIPKNYVVDGFTNNHLVETKNLGPIAMEDIDIALNVSNNILLETKTNIPDDFFTSKEHIFSIENAVNLEELLSYLKFNLELTQKDLDKIFRLLISNRKWLENNLALFGRKKENVFVSGRYPGTGSVQTQICKIGQSVISDEIYTTLDRMPNAYESSSRNILPSKEEPNYVLIKKR